MMKLIGKPSINNIDTLLKLTKAELPDLWRIRITYLSRELLAQDNVTDITEAMDKLLDSLLDLLSGTPSYSEECYIIEDGNKLVVIRTYLGNTYDVTMRQDNGEVYYGFIGLRDTFLNKVGEVPKSATSFKEILKYAYGPSRSINYWETYTDAEVVQWRITDPKRILGYANIDGLQSTVSDYRDWLTNGVCLLLKSDIPTITNNPIYNVNSKQLHDLWVDLVVANDAVNKAILALAVGLQEESEGK